MQKFVTFVEKNLKINMLKIKNIVKLETILIIQVNEYREAASSIGNSKYSLPKEIPLVLGNAQNCDYFQLVISTV